MKTNFSRIFFYLKPSLRKYRTSIIGLFFAYTIGIFFDGIAKPYLYKEIIDAFSSGQDPKTIVARVTMLGFILCGAILLYNIGYRVGDYINSYVQSRVMKDLNDTTFTRLLKHSYHFFSNNFSGSIVAKSKRFSKSFETLADIVTYQIWFSFVTLAGVITILFIKAPLLAYIFLGWAVVYIIITFLFIRTKMKYDTLEAEADSSVTAQLSDVILNIINIKIFGAEKREIDSFKEVTSKEEKKRRKAWYFGNFQNAVQAVLMGILQITILFTSIHLWYRGMLSLGMIVLLQMYMFNLFDILWGLGRSITKAIKAITDMKEIVDIFDLPIDIIDKEDPEPLSMNNGHIGFHGVTFAYDGGISVFEDFNLDIKPGERIGLVGHSGSGKSTITKLLLRFVDVSEGQILIDGQDIREITQNDLRSMISYVPQESILFHRTIRQNIAYGNEHATQDEIEAVARKAHAHEFILKLPHGYDTLVGERGVKLSGGERQRVAIARAMLKHAPILILDEATSSLDSVSESYIQDAFVELMKGKTTIVIAHRLSTIQKMDRIVVLEEGSTVEMGTHQELLQKGGVYANLWEHQSGGFISE